MFGEWIVCDWLQKLQSYEGSLGGKSSIVVDDFNKNLKGETDKDFLGDAMPQPQGKLQVLATNYIDV
jgi:hypothetical protein